MPAHEDPQDASADSKRRWFFQLAGRPYLPSAMAFFLTIAIARLISHFHPKVHWELYPGQHIHHFTFGIFALAIAGYLALVFKGPRATFFLSLFHGFGLGLTFDEFGLWLNLREGAAFRWNNTGLMIVAGFFLAGVACASWTRYRPAKAQRISVITIEADAEAGAE